ncbi:MAG: Abortive infection protein [Pedosphaera sp.]|nr:Abortive infection protein [Pedosphaera sp.]
MRPIRSLLIYIIVIFFGGALLAPWLYWLAQSIAPSSHLANSPFHRYLDRALLGIALIGMWPLLRSLGARSMQDLGLVKPSGQWHRLLGGFALGFISLACFALIVLAAGGRTLNEHLTSSQLLAKLAGAGATAVALGLLEELLFRGTIFGALRRIWDWRAALLVSSMIYAIVHFLGKADLIGPVTWHSGLDLLPRKLAAFGNWQLVIPGFFNLTLVGIMLGFAYQKTGNLYFSMGLHAGWIFWLKSYGALTNTVKTANLSFWGTEKLTDGWIALFILAMAFLILTRLRLTKSNPPAT